MEPLPPFFLNKNVLGSGLRLYLIFKQARDLKPDSRSLFYPRKYLQKLTGLSYNGVQVALRELELLLIVVPDKFDLSKQSFILNDSKDYNWEEIRRRQGITFGAPSSKKNETFIKESDSD